MKLMKLKASAFKTAISNIINVKTEVGVDTTTSTSQDIQDQISEMKEALQSQEEAREKRRILFQVAASTLALLTAPFGGLAFASIGYSVGTSVYGTYRTIKMAKEVKTGTNNILLNAYLSELMKRQLRQVHPLPIHVESDMEQSQFEFEILPGWDDPIADDDKFDWFSDIEEDVMDGATSTLSKEQRIYERQMENYLMLLQASSRTFGAVRLLDTGPPSPPSDSSNPITIWYTLIDFLKEKLFKAEILEVETYQELGSKLGFSESYIKDRTSQFKREGFKSRKVIDTLLRRLYSWYHSKLSESWPEIESKFLDIYRAAFPLDNRLPPYQVRTPPRINLYNKIKSVIEQELMEISSREKIQVYQKHISKILFNDNDYIRHNYLANKGKRLEITTLYTMLYYARNSRFSELEDILRINRIGIPIGDREQFLENIKRKISREINKFIFSNPYSTSYIYDEYGADYFKEKFELTIETLFLLSDRHSTEIKDGRKKCLTLKYVRKQILRIEVFGELTTKYGYGFGIVKRIQSKMRTLVDTNSYNKFLEISTRYLREQGIKEGSSLSEELMRVYMRYIFGASFEKAKPSWLIGARGGQMEFDGFNEELAIAFECDGPYHYNRKFLMNKIGMTYDQADRMVRSYEKNDAIKDRECDKRELTLIRLRPELVDFKDFQKYITDEYERLTGNPAPYKRPLDYRVAIRLLKSKFLNLNFFI